MDNKTIVGPKRRVSPTPEPVPPLPNPRKKVHKAMVELHEEESDEESEVEKMIIDDGPSISRPRSVTCSDRAKKYRDEIERNRKARREKVARRAERLAKQEDDDTRPKLSVNIALHSQSVPPESAGKRKGIFSSVHIILL